MKVELVIMVLLISKQPHFFIQAVSKRHKINHQMKFSFLPFQATRSRGAYRIVPYNEAEYKSKVICMKNTQLIYLDAFYGFLGNSIKPRHEMYRGFRDIEGLDSSVGSRGLGDISRAMS